MATQQEELDRLGCQVIMVASNGNRDSALKFCEFTNLSFQLLLDSSRQFYRLLGLKRSINNVWRVATLKGYAEEKVAGVPETLALTGDDLHVMGGDFVVDTNGRLVFAYASKTPRDGPTVDQVLDELRSMK